MRSVHVFTLSSEDASIITRASRLVPENRTTIRPALETLAPPPHFLLHRLEFLQGTSPLRRARLQVSAETLSFHS